MMMKLMLSFEECKTFAKETGIKTGAEWESFIHTFRNDLPKEIPTYPEQFYSRGYKFARSKREDFVNYEEAKKIVRKNKVKGNSDYTRWYKEKRPYNVPSNPNFFYKDEWVSWNEFTGFKGREMEWARKNFKWRKFSQAREYARNLKCRSLAQWHRYSKTKKLPKDIPATPNRVYKRWWKSWDDWLGTNISRQNWWSFKKARRFARSLKLKNGEQWTQYCKTNKRPLGIPSNPHNLYKLEWKGMGDWLGTGNISFREVKWRPYYKARKYARNLKLKSGEEWQKLGKEKKLPKDIPNYPIGAYRKYFKSWSDFLGNNSISYSKINWVSYEKCKELARKLKIKSVEDYRIIHQKDKFPKNVPATPEKVYQKEWEGWGKFLGTKSMTYEEARDFVRSLNLKNARQFRLYCKSNKIPTNLPKYPEYVYGDKQ